jgi:hypothetical protein
MSAKLEQRVAALEQRVANLQERQESKVADRAWLHDLYGKFSGDPVFDRAMKLGRKYRKSLRSGNRKAKPKR